MGREYTHDDEGLQTPRIMVHPETGNIVMFLPNGCVAFGSKDALEEFYSILTREVEQIRSFSLKQNGDPIPDRYEYRVIEDWDREIRNNIQNGDSET